MSFLTSKATSGMGEQGKINKTNKQKFKVRQPQRAARSKRGGVGFYVHASLGNSIQINQSIKTQDQQCQWPNKPRPQTQGS